MITEMKDTFCKHMPAFVFFFVRVLMVKQVLEVSRVHLVLKEMKEQEDFQVLQALLGFRYQIKSRSVTFRDFYTGVQCPFL